MNKESEPYDPDFVNEKREIVEKKITKAEAQSELRAGNKKVYEQWFHQEELALGENPSEGQRSALYMQAAQVHYMAGEIKGSIALLDRAIEIDPTQKKQLMELMDMIDPSRSYHKK